MTLGEQTAALYGGELRPVKRDRYGEIVDEPPIYPAVPPAITEPMKYEHWRRLWGIVLDGLTRTQCRALRDEMEARR